MKTLIYLPSSFTNAQELEYVLSRWDVSSIISSTPINRLLEAYAVSHNLPVYTGTPNYRLMGRKHAHGMLIQRLMRMSDLAIIFQHPEDKHASQFVHAANAQNKPCNVVYFTTQLDLLAEGTTRK